MKEKIQFDLRNISPEKSITKKFFKMLFHFKIHGGAFPG